MTDPAEIVKNAVDEVGEKAAEIINSIPGPEATPSPEVLAAPDPKAALEAALEQMKIVLRAEAENAVSKLATLSVELAQEGAKIVKKIAQVGGMYIVGAIDKASAESAVDNYLAAMQLLGMAEVNATKIRAFMAAQRSLQTLKSVLLALVQVGLSIASPAVGKWFCTLDLDAIIEKYLPKPTPQA